VTDTPRRAAEENAAILAAHREATRALTRDVLEPLGVAPIPTFPPDPGAVLFIAAWDPADATRRADTERVLGRHLPPGVRADLVQATAAQVAAAIAYHCDEIVQ
jgi:hypothetical protein